MTHNTLIKAGLGAGVVGVGLGLAAWTGVSGTAATAGARAAAVASVAQAEGLQVFNVDAAHTSILFRINHLGVSNFWGRFNGPTGSFTYNAEDDSIGTVSISVPAEKVDTNNQKRDEHLRGPDFFNAREFKTISFEADSVSANGDGTFDATGVLSLHGQEREVAVTLVPIGDGKDPWGGFRAGFETELTINRSDFGIDYMPEGLGDEVKLIVAVEGVRQ